MEFSNPEIIELVCELANLPKESFDLYWTIVDIVKTEHNHIIVTLHYIIEKLSDLRLSDLTQSEKDTIINLRGKIFDITDKKIICPAFGFTSKIQSNSIGEVGKEYTNQIGSVVTIDSDSKCFECFDGAVFRISFDNDGNMFTTTHKHIKGENSKYGESQTFGTIFVNLFYGEGSDKTLEDVKQHFQGDNNLTYYFLLCHPTLTNSSQKNVGVGKLIFLFTMEPDNTLSYTNDLIEEKFYQKYISLEEANLLLESGEDALIIDKNGTYRVIPDASKKRSDLLDNSSNLLKTYFEIITKSTDIEKTNEEFISAVPFHKKEEASNYLTIFQRSKILIAEYLIENFDDLVSKIKTNKLIENLKFKKGKTLNCGGKSIVRIINQTSKYISAGPNFKKLDIKVRITNSIETLISKEYGSSLYALYKCIKV